MIVYQTLPKFTWVGICRACGQSIIADDYDVPNTASISPETKKPFFVKECFQCGNEITFYPSEK